MRYLWLLLYLFQVMPAVALEALDDADLDAVVAREGIAMNIELLFNATRSGNQVTLAPCPDSAAHANGTANCRIALQFNDRVDTWLVLKDFFSLFALNRVFLDGVDLPSSPSGFCTVANGCAERFPLGFSPNGIPAIQFSYDHTDIGLNSAFYDDARLFLNTNITAEFGPTGFLDNAVTGSALGLRMASGVDGSAGAAGIRFDGRMMMFGF